MNLEVKQLGGSRCHRSFVVTTKLDAGEPTLARENTDQFPLWVAPEVGLGRADLAIVAD